GVNEVVALTGHPVGDDVAAADVQVWSGIGLEEARFEVDGGHGAGRTDPVAEPAGHRAGAGAELQAAPPGADPEGGEPGQRARVPDLLQQGQAPVGLLPGVVERVDEAVGHPSPSVDDVDGTGPVPLWFKPPRRTLRWWPRAGAPVPRPAAAGRRSSPGPGRSRGAAGAPPGRPSRLLRPPPPGRGRG